MFIIMLQSVHPFSSISFVFDMNINMNNIFFSIVFGGVDDVVYLMTGMLPNLAVDSV